MPQRAVQELQGIYNVAVVGADSVARSASSSPRSGSATFGSSPGLKPGERIVVEGVQKVRAGVKVNVPPPPKPAAPDSAAGA